MATLYGAVMNIKDVTGGVPPVASLAATVRAFVEVVTYATQTTSDVIEVGFLPKGAKFLYGVIATTVTTGAATIAIGISGATGKYRAAAAFTAVDIPTLFGITAAMNTRISADETVIITIGTASLPASGTLTVTLVYAHD